MSDVGYWRHTFLMSVPTNDPTIWLFTTAGSPPALPQPNSSLQLVLSSFWLSSLSGSLLQLTLVLSLASTSLWLFSPSEWSHRTAFTSNWIFLFLLAGSPHYLALPTSWSWIPSIWLLETTSSPFRLVLPSTRVLHTICLTCWFPTQSPWDPG